MLVALVFMPGREGAAATRRGAVEVEVERVA
jgi:hypothetical protein